MCYEMSVYAGHFALFVSCVIHLLGVNSAQLLQDTEQINQIA